MPREKNPCGKTRKVENPYEIWAAGNWEWRVLKKYKSPTNEAKDRYARWFVAVKSPMTYGSYEYGDEYCKGIKESAICIFRDAGTGPKEE